MLLLISSRQKHSLISVLRLVTTASTFPFPSPSAGSTSKLRTEYSFIAPPSFLRPTIRLPKGKVSRRISRRRPSKLARSPCDSILPFDFRYSYTESDPAVKSIGLREPKYSPFGPGRVDREWTGVCAPAVDPKVRSVDGEMEDPKRLEEKRKELWDNVQGDSCQIHRTRNGYYGNLVAMVRIDCHGLDHSDHKKIGVKLRDLVPCILVSFEKEQIIVWRGANYKSWEDGLFLDDRELFANPDDQLWASDLD